jgi:hypothetical protein
MKTSTQNHNGLKEGAGHSAHDRYQIALAGENLRQRSSGELRKIHCVAVSQPAGNPKIGRGGGQVRQQGPGVWQALLQGSGSRLGG